MNTTTESLSNATDSGMGDHCLLREQLNNGSCDVVSRPNTSISVPDMSGIFASSVVFSCGVTPVIVLIGIFGNILTLVILRMEKKATSMLSLQITVTVCDLIYLICLIPFSFYLCGHAAYPNLIEKITAYVPSYMFAAITRCMTQSGRVSVALLAIDRAISICFPFSKVITLRRTLLTITIVQSVILGIMVHDVIFFSFAHIKVMENGGYGKTNFFSLFLEGRMLQASISESYIAVFRTITKVVLEVLPVIIVCICNVMISRGLSGTLKSNVDTQNDKVNARKERNAKINRTLFLITCSFVLLCLPGDVLGMVLFVFSNASGMAILNLGYAFNSLSAANHAINFIIYGVSNTVYKERYMEVLCCKKSDESTELGFTHKSSLSRSRSFKKTDGKV